MGAFISSLLSLQQDGTFHYSFFFLISGFAGFGGGGATFLFLCCCFVLHKRFG